MISGEQAINQPGMHLGRWDVASLMIKIRVLATILLTLVASLRFAAQSSSSSDRRFRGSWNLPVTGTAQSLAFSGQHTFIYLLSGRDFLDGSRTLTFSGGLESGVVSGTMTLSEMGEGTTLGTPLTVSGSTTLAVTLR